MNRPSTKNTQPGRLYWRSLDELADTPEFREWAEREFPAGASELNDPLTRRHFMKIMSASFLLAGVGLSSTGCRRPVEHLEPFGKMPVDYVHGVPEFYATAMPTHGTAIPLVVKATDGRPIKIEGNALHPDSNGGTDVYAQGSILNLYDPDRATRFTSNGHNATPEAAMDFLAGLGRSAQANGGQGLAFLLEPDNSPSRRRLEQALRKQLPKARWAQYDPVGLEIHGRAASLAFGQSVAPYYDFAKADVVVSLDCDFLGLEPDPHRNIRQFARRRQLESPEQSLNRLYAIEGFMSVTGFNADHRLRIATSAVLPAAAILAQHLNISGVPNLQALARLPEGGPQWAARWLEGCAKDLAQNRGRSLVVAGQRQPLAVHLLAHAMNAALGNIGQTLVFHPRPDESYETIAQLAEALHAKQVETLVILGSNPVYTAPADLNWAAAQKNAKVVARLGYYEDETFPLCQWHFPAAHFLESWGDAFTSDGTLVPIQPLIAPLFGGWTELEVLARIAGEKITDPYTIVRTTFAERFQQGNADAAWRKFLHDGFLGGSASKPANVNLNTGGLADAFKIEPLGAPTKERLEVVFYRDYKVDDGRFSNNGWLQELPDPVTKIVWDNVVLLSHKTAGELGVQNADVVEISIGDRKIRGPIWIQPGFADYSLGLALGYGRNHVGRVAQGAGFDVYPLRTTKAWTYAVGASLHKTGETYPIGCTQHHWSMEGRPIIREANLEQYRQMPNFAKRMGLEESPVVAPLYANPFDKLKEKGLHQWGMSVDLNKCVGCSACMVACQSENNVPIVGKEQVRRGREMHWIRIDRYYSGRNFDTKEGYFNTFKTDQEEQFSNYIEEPQAVTQPMLCQHCEAAPCENVCPVNATSHDQEGLNVMTYNRCVGTRYCSNNCPYKVRRFNFFDYNKRPLNKLYLGPLAHKPEDEWELMKLVKNPDVTVRMRGVMEKCTFCLQRIEQAKIAQKRKAGASGNVIVPEGTFTTACAQACPAEAIVFGNLNDPDSRVSKLKKLERDYPVLENLLTKPRTTYLARVRNPNRTMPDFYEVPFTLREFEEKMGNPFKHVGHEGESAAGAVKDIGKGAQH